MVLTALQKSSRRIMIKPQARAPFAFLTNLFHAGVPASPTGDARSNWLLLHGESWPQYRCSKGEVLFASRAEADAYFRARAWQIRIEGDATWQRRPQSEQHDLV